MEFWMLFTLIALVLYGLTMVDHSNKFTKCISVVYVVFIWFVNSFRYMVGADYETYTIIYNLSIESSYMSLAEPSLVLLVQLLNEIGFSSQMLFLVYETILLMFLYFGIRFYAKNEQQVILALLMYTFFPRGYWTSMNLVRQATAVAIVLWSSQFIIKKNFGKYLLGIVFATFLHYSAIIFLPFYWMNKQKKMKILKSTLVISILIIFGLVDAFGNGSAFIMSYMPELIVNKYAYYLSDMKINITSRFFLIVLIYYYFHLLFDNDSTDEKTNFLWRMTELSLYVLIVIPEGSVVARFRDYFLVFFYVCFAIDIDRWKQRYNIYMANFCVIAMAIYFLYYVNNVPNMFDGVSKLSAGNIEYQFNFNIWK